MLKALGRSRRRYALTISSNSTTSVSVYTAVGSPTVQGDVIVTVNSGIWQGYSSVAAIDFHHASWPTGTTFLLVNYGYIAGSGGNANGGAAGNAIRLPSGFTVIINNQGYIYGGGGGGGSGASNSNYSGAQGGGGGGGQGYPGGNGGSPTGSGAAGQSGSAGNTSGPGAGGSGGYNLIGPTSGGQGGRGGYWGQVGEGGYPNSNGQSGNNGGAGGKAINLNSGYVSWLAGSGYPQVQGDVS